MYNHSHTSAPKKLHHSPTSLRATLTDMGQLLLPSGKNKFQLNRSIITQWEQLSVISVPTELFGITRTYD
eukprot:m.258911 g.258911  ORF g.258911 m.258911 type:complete len:70 (+) comp37246_c0_seq1:914-1123(+)